jgi:hypothetical protein
MQSQSFHVFVSSTYKDLAPYRVAVREALHRMRLQDASMEYFPTSDKEPTELSLDELDRCNVYVGIIGHRFGEFAPDGEHSITQAEYLHALRRKGEGKMRLLLYMADDLVATPPSLRESEDKWNRQQAFRNSLSIHTPRLFNDPEKLAGLVATDLFTLRDEGLPPVDARKLFDRDDLPVILASFDMGDERLNRVNEFLHFVSESFKELFHIDPRRPEDHPFTRKVNDKLSSIIPGVALDDAGGVLTRAGISHIILRARTAAVLLRNIPPEKLRGVAEEIGRGAAKDLIDSKVRAPDGLVPKSVEALVDLWAYWDRTGGWGKIQLVSAESPSDEADAGGVDQLHAPEWRLKIDNNFLGFATDTVAQANALSDFWAGYIQGFLGHALPEIEEVMRELHPEQRTQVRIPPYHVVAAVEHEPDQSALRDTFVVTFEKQRLSDSLQALTQAEDALKDAESGRLQAEAVARMCRTTMTMCRLALLSARDEEGPRFEEQSRELPTGEREVIRRILAKEAAPAPTVAVARTSYDACNLLIQRLSAASGGM